MTGLRALASHFPSVLNCPWSRAASCLVLRDMVDRGPIHKYNFLMILISVCYQVLG
jgi:hypothetical protein